MSIRVHIDWETLNKLDDVGTQLNLFTFNIPKLINSICDKISELLKDFKGFFDTLLPFLEEQNFDQSEIAKSTLKIYKKYFKNG